MRVRSPRPKIGRYLSTRAPSQSGWGPGHRNMLALATLAHRGAHAVCIRPRRAQLARRCADLGAVGALAALEASLFHVPRWLVLPGAALLASVRLRDGRARGEELTSEAARLPI